MDAISRNLFITRPGSSKADLFGTSIGSHRRTKSSASRSSTYTQTTTTADGSLAKFSYRSGSTNTAATSLVSGDDDSFSANNSSTSRKKLVKRGHSPGSGRSSPQAALSVSRSSSHEQHDCGDDEDRVDDQVILDRSDPDLTMRLELARRNSQSQHGKYVPTPIMEKTVEDTIYEGTLSGLVLHRISIITSAEEPPLQLRPVSRGTRARENSLSSSRHASSSPARGLPVPSQPDRSHSMEHRRFGPRSPSPLPSASPSTSARQELPSADAGMDDESFSFQDFEQSTLDNASPSPLPRSKRQAFGPFSQIDSTPKATNGAATPFSNVEPLSIKKKSSTRSGHSPYTPTRKHRTSPLSKTTGRVVSPRKVSPQTSKLQRPSVSHLTAGYTENMLRAVVSARNEV